MTDEEPVRKGARKAPTRAAGEQDGGGSLTPEERAAVRERARELRAAARPRRPGTSDEHDVLAAIAALPPADRAIGERLHALVRAAAPELTPRLWYGMPAYARDGKVLCFFQGAAKFKTRYATLGFTDQATLDAGAMWPTAFAIAELGGAEEERIAGLLRRGAG